MFNEVKIKELYPDAVGLMYKPMLIHNSTQASLQKACESGDYFGQIKKDGAFYQFVKGAEGGEYLFGRTVSKKTGLLTEKIANVPHIADALKCLPNKTILIGEIYYPGKSSRNTVEIMGCLPDKAVQRQQNNYGLIHYYLYDIIMYDGCNFVAARTGSELRYKILKKIFDMENLSRYDFLELAVSWEDHLYERIGQALAQGEEGMVLKLKNGFYQPDKRPLDNLKAKKIDYVDAFIMGFEAPTKEYYGKDITNWEYWINPHTEERYSIDLHSGKGSDNYLPVTKPYYMKWTNTRIVLGAYNNDGKVVNIGTISSGISDVMKEDMTNNPENYLNHVCKIQCMELDKKAYTIRHGFFRGMREDKNAEDCLITDIFEN